MCYISSDMLIIAHALLVFFVLNSLGTDLSLPLNAP